MNWDYKMEQCQKDIVRKTWCPDTTQWMPLMQRILL